VHHKYCLVNNNNTAMADHLQRIYGTEQDKNRF
jgi:hypothetical protein